VWFVWFVVHLNPWFIEEKRGEGMLIMRDISRAEVKKLKKGDTFLGSEISNIQRNECLISIVTRDKNVYNIHLKHTTCRVFKKRRKPAPQQDQL
jgi:hypothetical protein